MKVKVTILTENNKPVPSCVSKEKLEEICETAWKGIFHLYLDKDAVSEIRSIKCEIMEEE